MTKDPRFAAVWLAAALIALASPARAAASGGVTLMLPRSTALDLREKEATTKGLLLAGALGLAVVWFSQTAVLVMARSSTNVPVATAVTARARLRSSWWPCRSTTVSLLAVRCPDRGLVLVAFMITTSPLAG